MNKFISLLMALCLLCTLFSTALADDVMPKSQAELDALDGMQKQEQPGSTNPFEAGAALGSQYADFYFGGVQTMNGIFSTISLYAELPEYAIPTAAVLRVSYSCSDLILTDISSLTYYMNSTPFQSANIVHNEDGQYVQYITIPVELLKSGYNLLEISSYVRLSNDEGCKDDFNGANWVRFSESTCLRLYYEIDESANEIALLPYPFISLKDPTGSQSAVVVSSAATDDELTAAAILMADFGTVLSLENNMDLARISETNRRNLIYFGLKNNTPDNLLALLDQEVPPTGALIQRAKDANHEYLLVISNEPAALKEAAAFLADATRCSQVHAASTYITVGENLAYAAAHQGNSLALDGMFTLKDALGHGSAFSGPFEQVCVIYLPVAEDYTLSGESRFSLKIRYSGNLDFDRSLFTVFWGPSNIPLCSRKLTAEGATGETVTFSVPSDAISQSGTYVTAVFDLEVPDMVCTPRQMNTPWAYIAEDSTFYLPMGDHALQSLSLSNRPAPFQRSSLMNDVQVVLSDTPMADELILFGRTIAMLGAGSEPYGNLRVIRASEFNTADANYNMVIVGRAASNTLIRQMNDKLYFKYSDDMGAVLSNDKLMLSDAYAREVGTLQLLYSPWATGRAVMVLTAPDASGIAALTKRISTDVNRWSLTREVVLVDAHDKATSYQFTVSENKPDKDVKPSFAAVLAQNKDTTIFMLVGLGCMALLLLGALIVLIRVRIRQKHDR